MRNTSRRKNIRSIGHRGPKNQGIPGYKLTFRTLFWSSAAILAEPPEERGGRAIQDDFRRHNSLFLWSLSINHNFLQIGRPISDPLGSASGIRLSRQTSGS